MTDRSKASRIGWAAAGGLLLATGVIAWRLASRPGTGAGSQTTSLRRLLGAIRGGGEGAVAEARAVARAHWDGNRSVVLEMLASDHPRVRAAACTILGDRPEQRWVAALLPRAGDAHWRVREAAFLALSARRPWPGRRPMANTPLDERERRLLAWSDAGAKRFSDADLCEIYAETAHVEFGRPLAARCLGCHAEPAAAKGLTDADCGKCHEQIHRQWADGAHAQSLSHLHLRTVEPTTGTSGWMQFGSRRGLRCVSCHRQAERRTASRSATPQCAFTFRPRRPTAAAWDRCHQATGQEWRRWCEGRQPRRVVWPPGQLKLSARGDERTCIACHMPRPPDVADGQPSHALSARRNPRLLREGVHLQTTVVGSGEGRTVGLLLTNLAGHEYPTGTRRRAVRLDVGPSPAQFRPLATFRRKFPGRPADKTQPPLAPGEQRRFCAPFPPGAEALPYRLVYLRNPADPDAYTHEILSGAVSANTPPAPP